MMKFVLKMMNLMQFNTNGQGEFTTLVRFIYINEAILQSKNEDSARLKMLVVWRPGGIAERFQGG